MTTPLTDLLDELLRTYGPCGQEDAVRDVVRRELEPLADEVTADAAGNLVAPLHGTDRSAPPSGSTPTARCGSPRWASCTRATPGSAPSPSSAAARR